MYTFYTNQPVPSILHTTQESRQRALTFFKLGYRNNWAGCPDRIYSNIASDRICPMGKFKPEARKQMGCINSDLVSCAIGVTSSVGIFLNRGLLFPKPKSGGTYNYPQEILLYYHDQSVQRSGHAVFTFRDLTEDSSNPKEWGFLVRAKLYLERQWEKDRRVCRSAGNVLLEGLWNFGSSVGRKTPEMSPYKDKMPPSIRLVSLVVGC